MQVPRRVTMPAQLGSDHLDDIADGRRVDGAQEVGIGL